MSGYRKLDQVFKNVIHNRQPRPWKAFVKLRFVLMTQPHFLNFFIDSLIYDTNTLHFKNVKTRLWRKNRSIWAMSESNPFFLQNNRWATENLAGCVLDLFPGTKDKLMKHIYSESGTDKLAWFLGTSDRLINHVFCFSKMSNEPLGGNSTSAHNVSSRHLWIRSRSPPPLKTGAMQQDDPCYTFAFR